MDLETFKRFILQSNQERLPPKKWTNDEKSEEKSDEIFSEENCCEFKAFQGKNKLNITPSQIFNKIKEGDELQLIKKFDIDYENFHIILDSTRSRRNPIIFTFKGEKECIIRCAFVKNRKNENGYLLKVKKEGDILKVVKKLEKKQVQKLSVIMPKRDDKPVFGNPKKRERELSDIEVFGNPKKREIELSDIEVLGNPKTLQKKAKLASGVIEDTMNNMVKERMLSRVGQPIPVEVYEKLLKEPEYIEKLKRKADKKVDERIERFARDNLEKFFALWTGT